MLQSIQAVVGMQLLLCLGLLTPPLARAQQSRPLNICHAGSVTNALEEVQKEFLAQNPGVSIKDSSGGSLDLVRQFASGMQECDLYASADYTNIDLMMKPAGLAEYTIVFARGRMVLAYLASNPNTRGIARPGAFHPPDSVPEAVPNWYEILLKPGVRIGGVHPFLDPGSYRSHLIFQLAQLTFQAPNLYNDLLKHYAAFPQSGAAGPMAAESDFQFSYEHSARASSQRNPDYRYVRLPVSVDLSDPARNGEYSRSTITVPGLGVPQSAASVPLPATAVAWGVTIPSRARNREAALRFLELLLGASGTAALKLHGPDPVVPALVSDEDFPKLPDSLKPLVRAGNISRPQ